MSLAKKPNLRDGAKLRATGKPKAVDLDEVVVITALANVWSSCRQCQTWTAVRQIAIDEVWSALRFRPR